MASKNTIEILIKANSAQAVGALNKLQGTVAKPFVHLRKQAAGLSDAFHGITGVSLSTAGAFAAVGMAVNKLSDFIKTSATETVAYAQSVRE